MGVLRIAEDLELGPATKRPPRGDGRVALLEAAIRVGWVQGYNAQAVCTEQQIVIAADVTVDSPDFGHLGPMVEATRTELAAAGIADPPAVVLADAGYWHRAQMESITGGGTVVLIPPMPANARAPVPAGTAASTRSCAGCSPAAVAASSTPSAKA